MNFAEFAKRLFSDNVNQRTLAKLRESVGTGCYSRFKSAPIIQLTKQIASKITRQAEIQELTALKQRFHR
jgi:hypothetical protein